MLLIDIQCEKLQQLLGDDKIKIVSIKNIHNDFFVAVSENGDMLYFYFKNGITAFHNYEDKPAIRLNNGTKIFMENNKIHRENDQPAVIFENNFEMYFRHGKYHRENDKPAIIVQWCSNFPSFFKVNYSAFDNEDNAGYSIWLNNDKIHRLHKPAFVHNILHGSDRYFIMDTEFSEYDFKKACLKHIVEDF